MKKIIVPLLLAFIAVPLAAQDRGFGAGVIVGEPTGLSIKNWLTPTTAIDGAAAWSFEGRDSFHVHASYLIHNFNLITVDEGRASVYYGIGARARFREGMSTRAGVRVPVGLAYEFQQAPFELFAEVAPILDLSPSTDFSLNGAIGLRYYFN